jgi:hypothetical protein
MGLANKWKGLKVMRTIEARTTITDDRRLVLQLPQDVVPGEHDVVVLIDVRAPGEESAAETPLRWEDGLLVYGGETVGRIEDAIDDLREERMRHILAGHPS